MRLFTPKRITVILLVLVIFGGGIGYLFKRSAKPEPVVPVQIVGPKHEIIGRSVQNRAIDSYTYGNGETRLAFVGGVHGGYEWNSVLLAYNLMDYLSANPTVIPKNLTVTVIPSANPDGVYKVIGKEGRFTALDVPKTDLSLGRFNFNAVDLNRNFDCNWQATSTWQSKPVSAGTAAFSEPEARAIRDFVLKNKPQAVVFWHSQSNAVYASECNNGILPQTLIFMDTYAKTAGYKAVKTFDSYKITGDAEGWLASINIPAITVELQTHESIEWEKNLAGIMAVFQLFK